MSPELEQTLYSLRVRLDAIEQRNERVDLNKAWETSWIRKICILTLTYFVMCLVFYSLGSHPVLLNAVVPTLGFFLSSVSLPFIKKLWIGAQVK